MFSSRSSPEPSALLRWRHIGRQRKARMGSTQPFEQLLSPRLITFGAEVTNPFDPRGRRSGAISLER
jgi:hypothetical protein